MESKEPRKAKDGGRSNAKTEGARDQGLQKFKGLQRFEALNESPRIEVAKYGKQFHLKNKEGYVPNFWRHSHDHRSPLAARAE